MYEMGGGGGGGGQETEEGRNMGRGVGWGDRGTNTEMKVALGKNNRV